MKASSYTTEISALLAEQRDSVFSTKDFADLFKDRYSTQWADLVSRYGDGGKGCGRRYSIFGFFGLQLHAMAKRGEVSMLEWREAPEGWGSNIIRAWSLPRNSN